MTRTFLILLLVARFLLADDLEPQRYTIEDLEKMAKNKEWAQVILFIKDIPKVDQNAQWKSLLEKAAVGYLTDLKRGGLSEAVKVVEDLAVEFPALKKSYGFEKLQNEIYFEGYEMCFSRPSDVPECAKTALLLLQNKELSFDLRQKLAPMVLVKSPNSRESLCKVFEELKELSGFYGKYCNLKKNKHKSLNQSP